jgi:hypothetical protein
MKLIPRLLQNWSRVSDGFTCFGPSWIRKRGFGIQCVGLSVCTYVYVRILSCVRDSVANNNGFWSGWLDLLTPLFTTCLNHSQLELIYPLHKSQGHAPFSFSFSVVLLQFSFSWSSTAILLQLLTSQFQFSNPPSWVWVWCYDRRSVGQSLLE